MLVLFNVIYDKKHEYIWFKVGICTVLEFLIFYELNGVGHAGHTTGDFKVCVTECFLS